MRRLIRAVVIAGLFLASTIALDAQRGGRGGPPQAPREAAAVDLTGYWVSVITEDWKFRMVTPKKGVYETLPLNAEGRKVGDSWDPARDEAAGEQCRAFGAGNIMRMPTRLHITWEDANTLRVETDAGTQTRLFHFGGKPAPGLQPSWQGYSTAAWEGITRGPGEPDFLPIALNPREGMRGQSLEVTTTHLRSGYLRKNGVPYSARTTLKEYFDVRTERNDETWFVVTTIVEDPEYLTTPFVTTTDFKKQPDAAGWNPTACSAR